MTNKEIQKKAAPHSPIAKKPQITGTLKRVGGFVILSSSALENHVDGTIDFIADGKEITAVIQKRGVIGNTAILSDSEELLSLFSNGDHDVTASIC